MDRDERQQDQELAAFTDALLNEAEMEACRQPPLADTVKALARALAPQPPPAHLRAAVRRRLIAAWPTPRPSLSQQVANLFRQPRRRWVWAAVAALAVVALAAALLIPNTGAPVTGTAVGDVGWIALVAVAALVTVLVAVWIIVKRKP